jgi:hypothetical protein
VSVLEVEAVSKAYRGRTVVDEVTFEVDDRETRGPTIEIVRSSDGHHVAGPSAEGSAMVINPVEFRTSWGDVAAG